MSGFDFFELLSVNILLFIIISIGTIWLYLRIANKLASSWMNPIKFNVFTAGIGMSVVLFLVCIKQISLLDSIYIFVSSAIFWYTLIRLYPNKQRNVRIIFVKERYYAKNLFIVFYVAYIALTLFSYTKFGVPIFNDNSRLALYVASGGFGVIQRLQSLMQIYSAFYIFYMFYSRRINIIQMILLLLPLLVFGILSGSRSSFLFFIFTYWGFRVFYLGKEPKISDYKKLIIPFLVISFFTFFIQTQSINYALLSFGQRVIACGDLYWESLPNDLWKSVVVNNPWKYIFMGLLGPARILDATQAETPIGYQLTSLVYPGFDKMTGPVALFPISSLILYGYVGGLIYTICQSMLTAGLLRLSYIKSNSIILCAVGYYCLLEFIPFLGDGAAGMGGIFNVLLNLFVTFSTLLMISMFKYLNNKLHVL